MADYPILYRITHVVRCVGFEAMVVIDGRVLLAPEDGEWWCHGVEPGALTEGGVAPFVAFEKFRSSLRHVLDDLAEECQSVEEFELSARKFFHTDSVEEVRWNRALDSVREGIALEEPFQDMQRMKPRPSVLTVKMLATYADVPMREVNDSETIALPTAA